MLIVKSYLTLCRVGIAGLAACSAATGFFLGPGPPPVRALLPAAAVFLIACGSSALNQYQERDIDAKMERTRLRPLPAGTLSPTSALAAALALISVGLVILACRGTSTAVWLGVTAVLWYNGFYTPLKRITAHAPVPGAVVGMIPPAIGWAFSGGSVLDARLFVIAGLFFLWQIPHFLLLSLRHEDEYRQAGIPTLSAVLGSDGVKRIAVAWMFATAAAGLLLPLFGVLRSLILGLALLAASILLVWNGAALLRGKQSTALLVASFRGINLFIVIVMSLISLNSIYRHLP